jgi:hypothetical protein
VSFPTTGVVVLWEHRQGVRLLIAGHSWLRAAGATSLMLHCGELDYFAVGSLGESSPSWNQLPWTGPGANGTFIGMPRIVSPLPS